MRDDKYRYTKLGLRNSLLSLIPFVSIFSLVPGIFFSGIIGKVLNNCELGYSISMWICLFLTVFLIWKRFKIIGTYENITSEKELKQEFTQYSLGIYTLVNTALCILILGPGLACHGDGQSIMVVIFSGPLSSMGILLLGIFADLKIWTIAHKNA
ncbi:MAG: hypothetical protein ACM3P1_09930 [Candidatus Saccharibacteria bacterium]